MIDIENVPEYMPLEKSEPIVKAWVAMTANEIEYQTGVEVEEDAILLELSEKDRLFLTSNPDDDNDDSEWIDTEEVWRVLEELMNDWVADIKEEQEDEADYCEPDDLEIGFNPYSGCYDYDC